MATEGFVQYIALLFVFGALAGGAFVSLVVPLVRGRLEELEPGARTRRILFWSGVPAATGVLLVGFVLLPSLLDYIGLMADHCLDHASGDGHHGHLCPVHSTHMHAATTGWWLLGGVGLLLVARFGPALLEWRRARRRIDEIAAVAHPAEDGEWQVVDSGSPFAFTVGLVDPVVYLSSGLLERLDATSRRVVLAHELHHARRRHAVVKLAVRLGTVFVAPGTRSLLLSELGLALEQSSDSHAAEAVADPIPVAETILAVERLAGENRAEQAGPVGLASFGGGDIERRVRGLVDDPSWRPAGWGFWMVCAMAFVAAATHYEALHHGAETLFELL